MPSGHGEKLTRKQDAAIEALLCQPTILEAAKTVGIGEATLRRWLKLDDFTAAYRGARQQAVESGIARLQSATMAASDALLELLGAESEAVRLRAATAILDYAYKGVEMLDLETRIQSLEERTSLQTNRRVHGPVAAS